MAMSDAAASGCWTIGSVLGFAAGLIIQHFSHDWMLSVGGGIIGGIISVFVLGFIVSLEDK
jgi:hypothetical protein